MSRDSSSVDEHYDMGPRLSEKRHERDCGEGCMSRTHPVSLGDYQDQVEGMIDAGERFGVVEDTINAAALVEDQSGSPATRPVFADSQAQRQDAIAALALVRNCR